MSRIQRLIGTLRGELDRNDPWYAERMGWATVAVIVAGFWIRYRLAGLTYFGLDEAYHAQLSVPGFPDLWRTAHEPTHPPLLIFLLHYLRKLGDSELAFRLFPVIAGTLYPWVIYRWLRRCWNPTAGFLALFILTFSPALIELSAQVRAYTLALLLSAIALYCLERALREDSMRWMGLFAVSLLAALATEFSAAFFAAGLALYALVRFRRQGARRGTVILWGAAHAAAAAMYVHFLISQVIPYRAANQFLVGNEHSYFAGMFPSPGENPLLFFARGTLGQFQLAFERSTIEIPALVLFLAFPAALWFRHRRSGAPPDILATILFLWTPFLLACAAAYTGTYPYGDSRQTIFLSMFIAIGVSLSLDLLLNHRAVLVFASCALILPLWWSLTWFNPATYTPPQSRAA